MSEDVYQSGRWRGTETTESWLRRQETKPCACGCGELIIPTKAHRERGSVPAFILGHHTRVAHPNYRGVDKWVAAEQGKHLCMCGCNQPIKIKVRHHDQGIPRYLPNHSPRPDLGSGPDHPCFIEDRSRVKARGGKYFTPATMKEIRRRCDGQCARCGSSEDLEYDHIIPVSAGGGAEASNGQLLCHGCHFLKTKFERLLASGSTKGIGRFIRSLLAFLDIASNEINKYAHHRNAANIP